METSNDENTKKLKNNLIARSHLAIITINGSINSVVKTLHSRTHLVCYLATSAELSRSWNDKRNGKMNILQEQIVISEEDCRQSLEEQIVISEGDCRQSLEEQIVISEEDCRKSLEEQIVISEEVCRKSLEERIVISEEDCRQSLEEHSFLNTK